MGLKVVAEGVENEAAWEMLKAWGCDLAQGYYISAPMRSDEIVEWMSRSRERDTVAAS
jgi:EAL domain-containing protein (putative c-di-GMP-specific phosphodiesterase class I)